MSDFPLSEIPSWMAPEQRRTFWDHVAQTNILEMWRARDEFDEGVDPESMRGKVLAMMDELDRITEPLKQADVEPQDALDGAALRRLREALPEGEGPGWSGPEPWWLRVEFFRSDGWHVEVMQPSRDYDPSVFAEAYAPSIAEAADKCREALG